MEKGNHKMTEKIMQGIHAHIQDLSGFDQIEIIEIAPGRSRLKATVNESMKNLYGAIHGGALYTLCDMAAGMTAYAYGVSNVTLSGNINYVRPARVGTVFIECDTLHKGRSTIVQDVQIKDAEEKRLCTARMTMYITGEVEE